MVPLTKGSSESLGTEGDHWVCSGYLSGKSGDDTNGIANVLKKSCHAVT
jgi:hypothetical protein